MREEKLKFYDFSMEKLIELSDLRGRSKDDLVQFLAKKSNGDFEVMYLNYKNKIITFHLTEYGEYLEPKDYPIEFAILYTMFQFYDILIKG